MTLTQVLVTALAFIIAGIAKGAIGMGLPPIAIGIMSFAVPLESAIAMMVVPSMVTNVWQAIYGGDFLRLLVRFRTMAVTSVAALIFVAMVFGQLGSPKAVAWVGVILVIYAGLALTAWRPAVSRATERWANPLIGVASGAVAGITGVAAVPFLPYMQSLDIEPARTRAGAGHHVHLHHRRADRGAGDPGRLHADQPVGRVRGHRADLRSACGWARRPAMRSRPRRSGGSS